MVRPQPDKLEHLDMTPIRIFRVSQMTPVEPGLKNPALNESPRVSGHALLVHGTPASWPFSFLLVFQVCAFGTLH